MIKKYPKQCQELLLAREQKKITAAQVYELFVAAHSASGSNAREMELEIMQYWLAFLEECEGV